MKKIKYIIFLLITLSSLSISIKWVWANGEFKLDTTQFIKHRPILDSAVAASTSNQANHHNNVSVNNDEQSKIDKLNLFCSTKQRRGIVMQKENSQNYLGIRGGLMFKHTNCKNGNIGQIRVKRRDIRATYQIKF